MSLNRTPFPTTSILACSETSLQGVFSSAKANHLYLKNQLITSLVKNKNSQGSESAVPAFTTSQSSTVRDGIVGRATVGAVGRRGGCVQWTSTMDDALL